MRLVGVALLLGLSMLSGGATALAAEQPGPIPALAYYYIWFDHSSWNRAKTDYPLLGRYSSDDADVMRQHIRWAKGAGIQGFIVSWKNTPVLTRRLEQLRDIAAAEDFKLAVIYQGLDFERHPLPVDQIAADLDYFADHFAAGDVFKIFDKPMVIWSGTWEFSRDEVAQVTTTRRSSLLILASERNLDGYRQLGGLVDGNAYYWSSVDPATFPGYEEKLRAMGQVVHSGGGLWIAPAAPGFDARLIGGTRAVDRQDGATLRRQLNAAVTSSPDAIGLISWNEFSENSHLEPSRSFGMRYLNVLADILGAQPLRIPDFDSSEPAGAIDAGADDVGVAELLRSLPLLAGFAVLLIAAHVIVVRRSWRDRAASSTPGHVVKAITDPRLGQSAEIETGSNGHLEGLTRGRI